MHAEPFTSAQLSFCRALPKVELHAHLNGSIPPALLQQLAEAKGLLEGQTYQLISKGTAMSRLAKVSAASVQHIS